ncbi:DNA mismatch repair protein [Rhodotorula kratochvilovae]
MGPSSPGPRAIVPLPERTASLVRSAAVVPSLPSLLAELVQNSIDAHALAISCSVDLDTWTLRCNDTGDGLPHSDLALLRSAARHLTSKLTADVSTIADNALAGVSTYGFRGEALASISDLATLDIRTRARTGDGGTWELILRDGTCLNSGKSRVERAGHGTTVTVRDIFHKLPVRRRPLAKPAAQASLLASLRSMLASLALLHPHIAFSLTDTTTTFSFLSSEPRTLLAVARSTEGLVGRWRQLWGRAGVEKVWEFDEAEGGPNGDEAGRIRARGFFSLSAAHTKAGQHVFVNSRPLAPSTSLPHKLLNAIFAQSSFARFASSHLLTPSGSPAKKGAKSPRRAAERHPLFVLALEVPGRVVDVSLEPEKRVVEFEDPARIERFLTQLTKRFLALHGFLDVTTGAPAPAPLPASPFAERKRPRTVDLDEVPPAKRVAALPAPAPAPMPTRTRSAPGPAPAPVAHPSLFADEDSAPQRWVDPSTHEVWLVDPRTGNSRRAPAGPARGAATSGAGVGCEGCKVGRVDRRALKRVRGEGGEDGEEELPEWLRRSLENWENPIFPSAPVARAIPSLPPLPVPTAAAPAAPATLPQSFRSTKRSVFAPSKPSSAPLGSTARAGISAFFSAAAPAAAQGVDLPSLSRLGGAGGTAPVTRAQLAEAEFVAQVDAKYLLVRVPASPPPSSSSSSSSSAAGATLLLLVDQHAASERVRVERAYAALVGAVARGEVPATTPATVGVVVSQAEYAAVRDRWRGEFARWGIEVDLAPGEGSGEYRQLALTAVPALLAARLTSPREPHLAQALVRGFVAQLDDAGPAPIGGEGAGGERGWVAMLRHAPGVVKELLDSKACRGAVMFNDVLTDDQARALLAQLAGTVFPGQCAHGRPSMVPVVRFAPPAAGAADGRREEVDWARLG